MQNNLALANAEFNSLNLKNQQAVFSYISTLAKQQTKTKDKISKSVKEKLDLLNSLAGIVSDNIDLNDERTKRILGE